MKLSHLIILLISIVSVTAQEASVLQGHSITFQTVIPSTAYSGMLEQTNIVYSIPSLNYFHSFLNTSAPGNTLTNTIKFDVAPGNYTMYVTTEANNEVVSRETTLIHVLSSQPVQTQPSTQATVALQVIQPENRIFIPAIPDVTSGSTLVLPVTIRGNGNYELTIPKLSFATYETPGKFAVNGERTVPILLHISKDAAIGTYTVPISSGGDQFSVRVRVIRYVRESYWWFLVPIGLILIILGIIVLLSRKRKPKRTEDGELLTYY